MPKSQHPENIFTSYCLLHIQVWKLLMSSLFLIIFALCVSIAVNADKTKSFLLCAGKEELFRCFPTQTFAMVFPGMMWRISTQSLARLGLGSRDHFGAPSEQCTTWPPGTCSFPSRSSIEPSSSLGGGRSWHQVIICIYYSKLQCIQPHHIN